MKKGLNAISSKTIELWHKVNAKYGDHVYNLAVNGLDEAVLCKGYNEEVAKGNRNVQAALVDLLKA